MISPEIRQTKTRRYGLVYGNNLRNQVGLWILIGLLLYLFVSGGYWQATAVGSQIQVPMFYDAHYLFPRPWTQTQEAPGVPRPFPASFYGVNNITQSFWAGANNLALVRVWLAGAIGTPVKFSLSTEDGLSFAGEIVLTQGEAGGYYHLKIPTIKEANGRLFHLTLSAPTGTAMQPVVTHVIGGDRLGSTISLNEYQRPGNLELYTYSRGWAGDWWLAALAEQMLPGLFRLRVQQYKPALFKGIAFPSLLLLTVGLSVTVLVVARTPTRSLATVIRWGAIGCLVVFLGWQLLDGRLLFPLSSPTLATAGPPLPRLTIADDYRVVNDMTAVLWTANREPEARFVTTESAAGLPAIRVPANSQLSYALDVPLNGRFRTGLAAQGEGALRFTVLFDGAVLADEVVTAVTTSDAVAVSWLEIDLSHLAGHSGKLVLVTQPESGAADGLWLMSQLQAVTDWIWPVLPAYAIPIDHTQFGETVELAGYAIYPATPQPGQPVTITLYWRVLKTARRHAVVFVHIIDNTGELVAQHDSQPVLNSYPLPNWQPGILIADPHPLVWPDATNQQHQLSVGLYDPQTFARWPVTDAVGMRLPDDQLLLPLQDQP